MKKLTLPEGYRSVLTLRQTQRAIRLIKDILPVEIAKALNLERVTAPIIVTEKSGINDDLNGVERKVEFDIKEIDGTAQVVQSLAKWKRMTLGRFNFEHGEGLYTDMNAIRRDDDVDNLHSIFVDQWDWEKVISRDERNVDFLKKTVTEIYGAFKATNKIVSEQFPELHNEFADEVHFVTAQELEDAMPSLTPRERECEIVKKYRAVFIMGIGAPLKSGKKHDGRAPDYDDWSLNGDIFVWSDTLGCPIEISSMGVRVDKDALLSQLKASGAEDRLKYDFHKGIVNGTIPLTIGGGIGQSRVCMLLLSKAHIGEVQVSIWPDDMREQCERHGIILL